MCRDDSSSNQRGRDALEDVIQPAPARLQLNWRAGFGYDEWSDEQGLRDS